MDFIRPIVEERLAKMEEFGDTWDGAPVCWPVSRDYLYSYDGTTGRYAHVADERSQRSREVTRRLSSTITRSQLFGRSFNCPGKCYHTLARHDRLLITYVADDYTSIVPSSLQS